MYAIFWSCGVVKEGTIRGVWYLMVDFEREDVEFCRKLDMTNFAENWTMSNFAANWTMSNFAANWTMSNFAANSHNNELPCCLFVPQI